MTIEDLDATGCPPTFHVRFDTLPVDVAADGQFCGCATRCGRLRRLTIYLPWG